MDSINGISYYVNKCYTLWDTLQMTIFLSWRQHCAWNIASPTAAALSTNTAFEWKMWFSCFPVLPLIAEAQVIWGGTVKRLLIAYFISNISTKNYQSRFMCVKSYSKPKVGRFFRHGVVFFKWGVIWVVNQWRSSQYHRLINHLRLYILLFTFTTVSLACTVPRYGSYSSKFTNF